MPTLLEKAATLEQIAQSIVDEDYHNDVTLEDQVDLEAVVISLRATALTLKLCAGK